MAVQRLMFLLFPCCMIRHTRKQLMVNGSPSVLTFTAELFDIDKTISDIDMKFHIDFDR
jgi:hypothetical protein